MQRKQPKLSVASLMALMQPMNRPLPRVYRLDAQGRPAREVRKCALPGCLVEHTNKGGYCCAAHCREHTDGDRACRKLEQQFANGKVDTRDGKLFMLHDGRALAGEPQGAKVLAVCREPDLCSNLVAQLAAVFTLAVWYEHDLVDGQVLYSTPRPDLYTPPSSNRKTGVHPRPTQGGRR